MECVKRHEKWVALLANAGSPTEANKVPPSYVDTLRQLTPNRKTSDRSER